MSLGKEMPSCPPAALRCFLPAAFRTNFDKNRIVPVSELPAEYGAYKSTLGNASITPGKGSALPSKLTRSTHQIPGGRSE